ncbi:Variable major protein (plasmid) [Borrelia coriaceae ATCC 43381]|uniref:Variable major protein n=1 Tax=Borrelia coriaceae ATCC 43381 TaxID=1408429 RepID=W5SWM7_9SPIR|nr:Variable major protein [Borrelia coriaceae ATCC 43381]
MKEGLITTKNKLNELSSKIYEAKNADGSTIEAVKGAIKGANDIFDKLIAALIKLSGVTNGAGAVLILVIIMMVLLVVLKKLELEQLLRGLRQLLKKG